jgi:hypothetical protein
MTALGAKRSPSPSPVAPLSPSEEWMAQRIAARVLALLEDGLIELIAAHGPGTTDAPLSGFVDAGTVARELGVSRSFVYEHAAELGAVRIGDGERPRLRFDLGRAREAWNARQANERSLKAKPPAVSARSAGRRRARLGTEVDLLPIRGSERAV